MSPLTLVPDVKKVAADYLRIHADIMALNARVLGKTPGDTATPWVRVTQLDATDQGANIDHFLDYLLQFDCYVAPSEGQPQARLLARTVRSALRAMRGVQAGGVVITDAEVVGMAELYDSNLEPARDYVALTVQVFAHA